VSTAIRYNVSTLYQSFFYHPSTESRVQFHSLIYLIPTTSHQHIFRILRDFYPIRTRFWRRRRNFIQRNK